MESLVIATVSCGQLPGTCMVSFDFTSVPKIFLAEAWATLLEFVDAGKSRLGNFVPEDARLHCDTLFPLQRDYIEAHRELFLVQKHFGVVKTLWKCSCPPGHGCRCTLCKQTQTSVWLRFCCCCMISDPTSIER
jgi:hypothetical protein